MKREIAIILALILVCLAHGQVDSVIHLSDVIVLENRIKVPLSSKPSSITIIDRSSILYSKEISLAEILNNTPGVDIRQRGVNGIQFDAGIRGGSFDQVLVMLNGVRMNDSQTGHHNFNLPVNPDIIERIEVYKGPSARVFGQNAFSGAINIITRVPEENNLKVNLLTGSASLSGAGAEASFRTRTSKNHLSVSGQRSDGYRYNSDYRLSNLFYQGEIMTGAGTVGITAGLSDRKFGANGFYSGPAFPDQYEEIVTSILSASFSPSIPAPSVEMTGRIYLRSNIDNYILIRDNPDYYRNFHTTHTAGADINMSIYTRYGISGAGIELLTSSINSTRLGEHYRNGIAIFAEHRFNLLNGKLSATPGVQINHSSGFSTGILPGIDIGVSITPRLLLFLNTGYTFRVPTFTDLYYEDPGNLANPDLKPEYSLSHEAGLKSVRIPGVLLQASVFTRLGTNLIDRIRHSEDEKWMPVNIHSARFNGFEGQVSLLPGQMDFLSGIPVESLTFAYSYISSGIANPVPHFSRYRLDNLRNHISISTRMKYFASISHDITFRYSERVTGETAFTVDSNISYTAGRFMIFAGITNITGAEYYEIWQVIMPKRSLRFGASFSLNP